MLDINSSKNKEIFEMLSRMDCDTMEEQGPESEPSKKLVYPRITEMDFHSSRSAWMGSTAAARRAGINAASVPTTISRAITAA